MDEGETPHGTMTLAIDVGGSKLKAAVLDPDGHMVGERQRIDTPKEPTPAAVMDGFRALVSHLGPFDRVSVGFPGVVRNGHVLTAPNLDTNAWRGFALAHALRQSFGKPVRILNDAEVAGLGVVKGHGLECVITLGTGMGFAVFQDGLVSPHLELSHHPVHGGKTYDEYIGNAALESAGKKRWNNRVRKAIGFIDTLVMFDLLYVGGGNAKHIKGELPHNVRIVPNEAGITGGVRLWDHVMDPVFSTAA